MGRDRAGRAPALGRTDSRPFGRPDRRGHSPAAIAARPATFVVLFGAREQSKAIVDGDNCCKAMPLVTSPPYWGQILCLERPRCGYYGVVFSGV